LAQAGPIASRWFGPSAGNIPYKHTSFERSYIFRLLSCPMPASLEKVQLTHHTLSEVRAVHGFVMIVASLCAVFCAVRTVFLATSSRLGASSLHIDIDMVVLLLCVLGYFLDSRSTKTTDKVIKLIQFSIEDSLIGKAVFDSMRDACCAACVEEHASPQEHASPPGMINSSPKGSRDQHGHERRRPRFDVHVIECVQRKGVTHTLPKVSEVMRASIRSGQGDTAVKLFDHMLKKGAVPGAHLINKAVSNKFFQLVADSLDDKRIQMDGLSLLDLVRAHGIRPSPCTQNRLLSAWKDQLPESVVEYFVKMMSDRVPLSNWAYRVIVVNYERSDPAFALKVSNEMERSGIQLQKPAYNAVLCAFVQLGMHNEAQELFRNMANHAVAPNARSYAVMIKVYLFSGQFDKAIAIFDAMRELSFEPDRYAYHYTIRSCIMLQRVDYAVKLYEDSVQAKVPLCTNTYVNLTRACKDIGWTGMASKLKIDFKNQRTALMKEAEALISLYDSSVA